MSQRVKLILAVLTLATVLLTGCGGQETPVEQAEEEAGVEEVVEEETAAPYQAPPRDAEEAASDEAKRKAAEAGAKATPFEGEHENLEDGDTATWNSGLTITISEIYTAPNETRRKAEENQAREEAKAKEKGVQPKGKSPALDDPEQLIGLTYTVTNEGEAPINFNGELPCTGLDSNGIELRGGGLTAEQSGGAYKPYGEILKQPLEQGQTRSGVLSIPTPDSGVAEFVCVHPPQQGGRVNVGQIPEQGRANWILDPAILPRRD